MYVEYVSAMDDFSCLAEDPTFSKPQNLSLPSSRKGPASSKCRSRGVMCCVLGSFFEGEDPENVFDVVCVGHDYQPSRFCPLQHESSGPSKGFENGLV